MVFLEHNKSNYCRTDKPLVINCCGILRRSWSGVLRKNGRLDYHLLYVESGICHLEHNGKMINVGPGGMMIFRPNEPQHYYFEKGNKNISHYVHFTGSECEKILKALGIYEVTVFNMGKSSKYEDYSAKLCNDFKTHQPYSEDLSAGLLYVLLSIIARKYALRNNNINRKNEVRINNACRVICENIAEKPSISALAAESGLSLSRFSHLFSEVTGKSVSEYVITMKMDSACRAFEETDLPVSEVAKSVGYSDPKYFSTIFKKYVGYSPRQYIKIVHEQN